MSDPSESGAFPLPIDWVVTTVSDVIISIDAGKSPDCPDIPASSGEWGVLKVSAVQPDGFKSQETKIIVNKAWINPAYEVQDGDLLISRSNTFQLVGIVCHVRSPQPRLMLCDKTLRMRVDPRRAMTDFVFWQFQQPSARRHIEVHATGTSGSMKNISQPSIRSLKIPLPPLPQQRKIARVLTTLDNVITQTEALIAKYQAIKQGLMHDLFTRGVDATGKLRPPQSETPELYKQSELGWIPKEWGSTTVAEVLQHRPKNGYSPKESDEWTGTVMLGLGCLTLSGFHPIQLKNAPKNDANLERALLKDGDLLISRSNTRDLVALVGIYREIGIPCIYSDLMMRLVPANVVLPEYLEAILRHAPVRSQLTNASCGTSGSMMKINSEAVLRTVIALPSLEEQRVLLSRMTAISSLIEAELLQRTSLRSIKTGLMQDLLTGRVPVKADEAAEGGMRNEEL